MQAVHLAIWASGHAIADSAVRETIARSVMVIQRGGAGNACSRRCATASFEAVGAVAATVRAVAVVVEAAIEAAVNRVSIVLCSSLADA